jgi:hypothetical protein
MSEHVLSFCFSSLACRMKKLSYIEVSLPDGRSIIIPASHSLPFTRSICRPLVPTTRSIKNKLTEKRIEDEAKDRMARIAPRPQSVAVAVSRFSSQAAALASPTPSPPATPDDDEVKEDPLVLGRTVKRRKLEAVNEYKLVHHPQSRLSSIKT